MDAASLFNVKVRASCKPNFSLSTNEILQGKVVLVTGGAKGIGRMISEGFVTNGATVYISSRDAKACEQACKELNALGKGRADYIAANFYKEEDCKALAEELKRRESSTSERALCY
jgi:NAD(P)-dependent dehydrogenase (short-subunit alcohol dehydrogenase family)